MLPFSPTIIRSAKRRRTVALHVEADGALRVLAPLKTSQKWIEAFIAEKAHWIARRRQRLAARASAPSVPLADGVEVPFQGLPHRLFLNRPVPEGQAGISLFIPEELSDKALQAEIQTALTLWYKKEARRVFPARLAHWAGLMKLRPARIAISAAEKRWGSCSAKNDIRLSWRLIKAPPELLDYVIVHELCHIPHKNHGARFWRLVEATLPDAKARRKALSAARL